LSPSIFGDARANRRRNIMQILYLIRHGETEFNRDGRVQGHTESDLSELGVEQAERVADRLRDVDFAAAYTSPLRRAAETCRIALAPRIRIEARDGLKEIHLGAWEGETASDLRTKYPREVKQWFVNPSAVQIEGAETIDQFRQRVTTTIESILKDHVDEVCAVVAHGGVICTYLTSVLGMASDDIWRFKIRNGSVTRLIYPRGIGRIDLLGDVHHLDGVIREVPESRFRIFP